MTTPRGSVTAPTRQGGSSLGATLLVGGIVVGLDQATKALAVAHLSPGQRIPLLGDLLGLSLIFNPGAAFSLGTNATWVFTGVGILACIAVTVLAHRQRGRQWGLALGLVLGGALGNLVDRFLNPPSPGSGHVTDFLAYGDLFIGNVADIFVVIGMGMVFWTVVVGPRRPTATAKSQR